MTLTISPELERRIVSQARERGISPDAFVAEILNHEVPPAAAAAEQFLKIGSPHAEEPDGDWPGRFETREDILNDHPPYRVPGPRPSAESLASALRQLASSDRPQRDYPEAFFSRSVIYADHG